MSTLMTISIFKLEELGISTLPYVVYDDIDSLEFVKGDNISVEAYGDKNLTNLLKKIVLKRDNIVETISKLKKTYGRDITVVLKEVPTGGTHTVVLLSKEIINYDGGLSDSSYKTLKQIIDVIVTNFNLSDTPFELTYGETENDLFIDGLERCS